MATATASSFDAYIEQACKNEDIPGAVMVATNASGSFTYAKAIEGRKDLTTPRFELDSQFRMMSCTKLITTIAVLQCVEKGLIGLDDDVGSILPDLADLPVLLKCDDGKEPVFTARNAPITLRLLLTHSAGLSSGLLEQHVMRYRIRRGEADLAHIGRTINERYYMPLAAQPGSYFAYSSGHDFAGKIVEKLTGETLDEYFREYIAAPLGITSFTFWLDEHPELKAKMLQISKRGKNGQPIKMSMMGGVDDTDGLLFPMPEWPLVLQTECFGGEGLKSSMPDYLKVLHSLLANDGTLLSQKTVNSMFIPQMTAEAHASLNAQFSHVYEPLMPGEYAEHADRMWGLGALLTMEDVPGWRGKSTLIWSGMPNLLWFIDRQNNVCGIFGTQLLPTGDDRSKKVITAWEKEMHRLAKEAEGK